MELFNVTALSRYRRQKGTAMTKDKLKDDKLKQLKQQKKDMEKEIASLHGDGFGNKLKGVLIFFMVIILFLVLLAGMVKTDIGGFGSGVLAPVIGNISGLNKILPAKSLAAAGAATTAADTSTTDSSSADASVTGTPTQVTQSADNTQAAANATSIANTPTPSAAPAASASPTSNTQTNTQSAADVQAAEETKLADYVAAYSKMDAKSAASILGNMTGNLHLVAKILTNMSASKRADILANMDINIASKLTVLMAN